MKKTCDSKFKSRVALEAMRGELTIAEIASECPVPRGQGRCFENEPQYTQCLDVYKMGLTGGLTLVYIRITVVLMEKSGIVDYCLNETVQNATQYHSYSDSMDSTKSPYSFSFRFRQLYH